MNFAAIVGALVTLLVSLLTLGAAQVQQCQGACPKNYDPICANTGNGVWVTFGNKCTADFDACEKLGLKEYAESYKGECK